MKEEILDAIKSAESEYCSCGGYPECICLHHENSKYPKHIAPDAYEQLVKKIAELFEPKHRFVNVPYQKCPKCDGQGCVSKPTFVAGDVHTWSSTSATFPCDVCNGQKIIPMLQLQKVDDWISVKDRLPKKDENVLIGYEGKEDETCTGFIDSKDKNWYNQGDSYLCDSSPCYPTHWKTLPESPKKN